MFLDVNLPFNLIVTAKTSAPEQIERPSFLKAMLKAWAHSMTSPCTRSANFKKTTSPNAKWFVVVAVQTERPEILKEG